jgi:hypothetical protein
MLGFDCVASARVTPGDAGDGATPDIDVRASPRRIGFASCAVPGGAAKGPPARAATPSSATSSKHAKREPEIESEERPDVGATGPSIRRPKLTTLMPLFLVNWRAIDRAF